MATGCGDVLSLEDLQIAKKHQLFEAEVITGLQGGVTGGASIDYATNGNTGQLQKTMPAILRDIGFTPASFDFLTGGTIAANQRDLAVLWPLPSGDGDWYYWEGALPKIIPASSTPATTGGVANGAWRPVGDITLRNELVNSGVEVLVDDTRVGVFQPYSGAEQESQHAFNARFLHPQSFGAIGDGVANDNAAFLSIEATSFSGEVDLQGKTYLVDVLPTQKNYANGAFKLTGTGYLSHLVNGSLRGYQVDDKNYRNWSEGISPDDVIIIGRGAATKYTNSMIWRSVIAAGVGALHEATSGQNIIALGAGVMGKCTTPPPFNIGIGDGALAYLDEWTSGSTNGTRNIAIGSLAGHFQTTGFRNIFIGRDCGHNATTAQSLTAVGYQCLSGGQSPIGWSGLVERNYGQITNGNQTAAGSFALTFSNGFGNTGFGQGAGSTLRRGERNNLFGISAGESLDKFVSYDLKVLTAPNITGTYSTSGAICTVTATASGVVAGNYVQITFTGGSLEITEYWLKVASVIDANNFTISLPANKAGASSGSVTVLQVETAATASASSRNTIIGGYAAQNVTYAIESVVVGDGSGAGTGLLQESSFVGVRSANNTTRYIKCSGIGLGALRFAGGGGSTPVTLTNSTGVGQDSRVTGDNQVQLGDTNSTPYAQTALQVRSDARDKTDTKDSGLGSTFILGLRPVEGVRNPRDAYVEEYQVQVGIDADANPVFETRTRFNEQEYAAGTKKGTRVHQWFLAQEVEALCKNLEVDFAGLHHAQVNGGADVYSLGYDEFIPPIVKTLQECWSRMDDLEKRIKDIESK